LEVHLRGTVFHCPYHVTLRHDLPKPRILAERDAVVRVTRAAICGTDLHAYRGELPGFATGSVLGHEFTGVVVEAGAAIDYLPGQRVVASDLVACGRCPFCAHGWHYQCPEVILFGYSSVVGRPLDGGQAEYARVPFANVVFCGRAFARELTLRFAGGDPIAVRERLIPLIQTGRIDPTVVISHRLPLEEVARGYEVFDRQRATKVILIPEGTG
jgi:threonine dehydrogenase-like Zn-dependent dehydrogenase